MDTLLALIAAFLSIFSPQQVSVKQTSSPPQKVTISATSIPPSPSITQKPKSGSKSTTASNYSNNALSPTIVTKPTHTPTPIPNYSVHLNAISPLQGKVGDTIILTGSGFGKSSFYYPDPSQFQGMISFYGPSGQNSGAAPWGGEWKISDWTDAEIKARVPGVTPGTIYQVGVTSSEGQKSNRVSFEVIQ